MNDNNKSVTQGICIRLPVCTINYLKGLARKESVDRGEDVTYSDLIRRSIRSTFPMHSVAASLTPSELARGAYEMTLCDSD
jgi:hypothetical protein